MTHSILVEVLYAVQNLTEKFGCGDIINSVMPDDVVEELSCIDMLHNKIELALSLDDLVELYDPGVANLLENFDLAGNAVNVHLILNLVFFENLDSHLLLRNRLNAQLHLSKCTFSEGLVDQEMRNLPQLLRLATGRGFVASAKDKLLQQVFLLLQF